MFQPSRKSLLILCIYFAFMLSSSLFLTSIPLLSSSPHSKILKPPSNFNLQQSLQSKIQLGLGLGPKPTSLLMSSTSFSKLIFKSLFPLLHFYFGSLSCFKVSTGLVMGPSVGFFPLLAVWTWNEISRNNHNDTLDASFSIASHSSINNNNNNMHEVKERHLLNLSSIHSPFLMIRSSFSPSPPIQYHSISQDPHAWLPSFLIPLIMLSACAGAGEGIAYLALIMMITDSVEEKVGSDTRKQYGLIHGFAGCLASIAKTLGPTLAGMVWEYIGGTFLFIGISAWIILLSIASWILIN